ncbi:hypothetical protein HYV81_04230 [Candidatus Woesearchaeota archaeon]|nr:hypothetical protein [Candidatus Woesearchaeota archaeon]
MDPLKEQQLDKLNRLTFHAVTLVYSFIDKENKEHEEPQYIKIMAGDTLIAVADGIGLRKSEKALALVPLEMKPKVEMDLKRLELVYSDAVSFATYYPEDGHSH